MDDGWSTILKVFLEPLAQESYQNDDKECQTKMMMMMMITIRCFKSL